MAFLKAKKVITAQIGTRKLTINQYIIPDGTRATKNICAYIKKGALVKPNKKLNDGTGKPRGITVHNTGNIVCATGTNMAEQYSRATVNGNMGGVVVHYYVWHDKIWQLLAETEQGWHAADGTSRRSTARPCKTIGGNLDTIAIECIGPDKASEDTTAALCAYLCKQHGLAPDDVYSHNYFYKPKYCPLYILPHWSSFKETIKKYYVIETPAVSTTTVKYKVYTVQKNDSWWSMASKLLGSGLKYNQLAKYNGMTSKTKLFAGMKIKYQK